MYAVCKGQFSVRDRGAAAALGEVPRAREHGPIVIIAVGTMRPFSLAIPLWKLQPLPSQRRAGQCARASNSRQDCEMCSRLTMRQLAICSRSGMNFAHTVNASYMQALRPCSSSAAASPATDARTRPNSASPSAVPKCKLAKPEANPCLFGHRRIGPCARHPQSRPHAPRDGHAQTRPQSVRW
jgi:hypothetical protein